MSSGSTPTLGQRLRAARGRLQLKQVAPRAGLAVATISRIERDEILPSQDALEKLVAALGGDPILRKDCLDSLAATERVVPQHRHFGKLLSEILERYDHITSRALAYSRLDKSTQVIGMWLGGERLPSGGTLGVLLEELMGRGASQGEVQTLRVAHIYDTVFDDKRLDYLTTEEKDRMLRCGFGPPPEGLPPVNGVSQPRREGRRGTRE